MKHKQLSTGCSVVTLSRRNLETLLAYLDAGDVSPTILSGDRTVLVHAQENDAHYTDREPGRMYINGAWV
jgi:hypothetical protein